VKRPVQRLCALRRRWQTEATDGTNEYARRQKLGHRLSQTLDLMTIRIACRQPTLQLQFR
jgi:hypothetical protein